MQGNYCASCEQTFAGSINVCPNDGTIFAEVRRIEQLLFNRYQIISFVGSGGMGSIYKGKQQPLGRLVAIKMLKFQDPLQCARFKQEAQLSSYLDHPNIIHVYDFGATRDGNPFMVMDFVDGVDLSQLIQREGVLVEECLQIFRQICDGMQHAHDKGIIHRDLKPSNVMLSDLDSLHPTVRIVDFGIAKAVNSEQSQHATKTQEMFGSPYYMSPEQALGKDLDARSDIYSLGCMMYEVLTGTLPIAGSNPFNTLRMHVTEKPMNIRERCPSRHYSETLDHLILKTLAKEPSKRFQNMHDLKTALSNVPEAVEEIKKVYTSASPKAVNTAIAPASEKKTCATVKRLKLIVLISFVFSMVGGVSAFCLSQFNPPAGKVAKGDGGLDDAIKSLARTAKDSEMHVPRPTAPKSSTESSTADVAPAGTDNSGNLEKDLLFTASSPNTAGQNNQKIFLKGISAEAQLREGLQLQPNAAHVFINDANLTDHTLDLLKSEPRIRHLFCSKSTYTSGTWKILHDMPQLWGLSISIGELTDNFVDNLSGLNSLIALDLSGQRRLTEKTLARLPKSIEDLHIKQDVGIPRNRFGVLAQYQHLRRLDLCETQISDEGLSALQKLQNLEDLDLTGTAITDDGVDELLKLKKLKSLELSGCMIGRDGLFKLVNAPQLKELRIYESDVLTEQDFNDFRKATTRIRLVPFKPNIPRSHFIEPKDMR